MRLLHELRVTSYFYCTSYELLFAYELRVTVNCTSYELLSLHELRVIVYCTSYELLFIVRITSYCLLHELRVTVSYTSYELHFACELRVNLYMWVTSYLLIMSYNKDKDDKAVYYNKVMLKNYLRSLFDKELQAR